MKYLIYTLLSTLPILTFSSVNLGQNIFYGFTDHNFQKEVDSLLIDVKNTIKDDLAIPLETHITNRSILSTMYNAGSDTLNILQNDGPSIVHELGHQIFDFNLTMDVPIWDYFKVKNTNKYQDLKTVLDGLEMELERWTVSLTTRQNSSSYHQTAKKKIRSISTKIRDIQRVIKGDSKFEPIVRTSNIFKRITPYQELFADILTVKYFNNWESVYNSALKLTGDAAASEYRKFQLENNLPRIYTDPYSYFLSFKVKLRTLHKEPKEINLKCAYDSVAKTLNHDLLISGEFSTSDAQEHIIKLYSICIRF